MVWAVRNGLLDDHPTYILTEPRFGYRMEKKETADEGEPTMYPLW